MTSWAEVLSYGLSAAGVLILLTTSRRVPR